MHSLVSKNQLIPIQFLLFQPRFTSSVRYNATSLAFGYVTVVQSNVNYQIRRIAGLAHCKHTIQFIPQQRIEIGWIITADALQQSH